jgi:hypothetical protein
MIYYHLFSKTYVFAGNSSRLTPSPKKSNDRFYNKVITKAAVGTSLKSVSSKYSSPVLTVNDEGNLNKFNLFHTLILKYLLVQVVDAQDDEFKLPKDLYNLDRFKPFTKHIPHESIVMVIYTTSKWTTEDRPDETNISHHVHAVVVLKAANK